MKIYRYSLEENVFTTLKNVYEEVIPKDILNGGHFYWLVNMEIDRESKYRETCEFYIDSIHYISFQLKKCNEVLKKIQKALKPYNLYLTIKKNQFLFFEGGLNDTQFNLIAKNTLMQILLHNRSITEKRKFYFATMKNLWQSEVAFFRNMYTNKLDYSLDDSILKRGLTLENILILEDKEVVTCMLEENYKELIEMIEYLEDVKDINYLEEDKEEKLLVQNYENIPQIKMKNNKIDRINKIKNILDLLLKTKERQNELWKPVKV
ncbi:hypothetical protein H1S01_19640 [Heliobacterium chlorum]|uniref:Uncharacterized protein n=1 Tax=Heliobacterium chlorum TaxID=2698 RepID=A0ABR7T8N3_HELCL|nr:hypothetical protein [Heliobacterium chlorum]MBC9786657.1 hypothetical protein [Heliobacterium chlorum]